jgi:hypothetical protein
VNAPDWNDDFSDFVEALVTEHVEFVIVGAHAMAVHGVPRATGDLDILVRPTPENAACVMRALLRFRAPVQAHGIQATDFCSPGTLYQIGLPPRRIDVHTAISGVDFETAYSTRVFSKNLPFIGRDALLTNKRAAARPKDLVDVEQLEAADRAT